MNRAVMAARAAERPVVRSTGAVSRNLLARTQTEVKVYGWTGTRRHGNKRTGKGGSSTGGTRGMWATVSPSQHRKDAVQIDARWGRTVTEGFQ